MQAHTWQINWDIDTNSKQTTIPTNKQLHKLKHNLKNTTIGYLDKEDGLAFIACPKWYWRTIKQTFYDDNEHYIHTTLTCKQTFDKFKHFAEKNQYDRNIRSSQYHDIPYCYTLPKAKDFNRFRPIVSYYNHPLKDLYNYTSRALMFILKKSPIQSFTLWKTTDLVPKINKASRKLQQTYGSNTNLICYCADIKNMYTSLPHNAIITSIQFMIECFKKNKNWPKMQIRYIHRKKETRLSTSWIHNKQLLHHTILWRYN